MNFKKILVVCAGNICRSPMGEAFFKQALTEKGYTIDSAGIVGLVNHPADDKAIKVMADIGIDISEHRGKRLNDKLIAEFDLVLVMTQRQVNEVTRQWGFSKGRGAIASISRETANALRKKLLTHEAFHGMYFVRPQFREYTTKVYADMPDGARQFIRTYFGKHRILRYDIHNQYLLENEFMAYLLQQPLSEVTSYVQWNMAGYLRRRLHEPEALAYIEKIKGSDFKIAARALNDFVYAETGLVGGRVWSLAFERGAEKHPFPPKN